MAYRQLINWPSSPRPIRCPWLSWARCPTGKLLRLQNLTAVNSIIAVATTVKWSRQRSLWNWPVVAAKSIKVGWAFVSHLNLTPVHPRPPPWRQSYDSCRTNISPVSNNKYDVDLHWFEVHELRLSILLGFHWSQTDMLNGLYWTCDREPRVESGRCNVYL